MATEIAWWQSTSIYHIYPRSFQDSNGDGIGDLPGIISRLDYLHELGFETIWISPFFGSPQRDWGYDISAHYEVAPEYGTLADVDRLIDEVHARGMRVLFDLVLNHTSDEHPWFLESRSSRDNPRRDWYIWRDGRNGRPPNNWKAIPGGPAWQYDPRTGQYYCCSFLPFQPDLNYRNPAVKEAMFALARHWLDRGVDGFRLDIFHALYKDSRFRDNPFSWRYIPHRHEAGYFQKWIYNLNRPETRRLAQELRILAGSYDPPRLLVGEVYGRDEQMKSYVEPEGERLDLIFLWDLLEPRASARFMRRLLRHHEDLFPPPLSPTYVLSNLDEKRSISKLDDDPALATLMAVLQFTARGVPVTYYGEEIGMADLPMPAATARDPLAHRYAWIPDFLADWLGVYVNRDRGRTPMQWSDEPRAGFCPPDVEPWLPVHENYRRRNVRAQWQEPGSLLNGYRQLLHLRRDCLPLRHGTLRLITKATSGKDLVAYVRAWGDEAALVLINVGAKAASFHNQTACRRLLFATGLVDLATMPHIVLGARSAVILGSA